MNPPPFQSLSSIPPQFVDLGHSQIAYRILGSGPYLLLVHGYPLSGLTFRHLTPVLAKSFTCVLPDLPGLGDTRWTERTDFGFAMQAETLRSFIDVLGLKSYAVVAHDTGGTIARRLAVLDRERLTRMVLIGTEIPGHRPPWIPFFQRIADPNRPGPFKFLMQRRWFRRSSAAFGGCFTDLELIDGEFFDLFLRPILADDRRVAGQTRYLMGIDWELLDELKMDHAKISAPVLLVWGEDDPVFPLQEARLMTTQFAHPAGFVAIPGGKLFVHEEMPEVILPILCDFLLSDLPQGEDGRHSIPGLVPISQSLDRNGSTASVRTADSKATRKKQHPILDAGAMMVLAILVIAFVAPALTWVLSGHPIEASSARSYGLRALVFTALLALSLPILQITTHIRRFGGGVIRGNRDYYPSPTGVAGRIVRAHANTLESLVPFSAVVLAASVISASNRWTVGAACLFLGSRVVHTVSYLLGMTMIRSAAFYAGWIATAVIALVVLLQAV